jgi:diaminohydroxyphosphoribosylaminopyrimidine deaminase / 5-amino-6-(5-phosphoribosylamino)uracil reductase
LGVTLKLATSLDGRIATASGESRWITGEEARAVVHGLRAHHDAVVIGIETALADDPELTVRQLRYKGRQPARIVLDSRCRLPVTSKLAQSAREIPTYLISTTPITAELKAVGVRGWQREPVANGYPDLGSMLALLDVEGLENFLVEGGGQVAASFIRAGLVDRVEWFRAPVMLGGEGRPCIGALALARLAEAPRFRRVSVQPLGEDLWERYERV